MLSVFYIVKNVLNIKIFTSCFEILKDDIGIKK